MTTPNELADALDQQVVPHDSGNPCEDCDTLAKAARALRRLAAIDVAAHAYHEAFTYHDQRKALDALLAALKTETE